MTEHVFLGKRSPYFSKTVVVVPSKHHIEEFIKVGYEQIEDFDNLPQFGVCSAQQFRTCKECNIVIIGSKFMKNNSTQFSHYLRKSSPNRLCRIRKNELDATKVDHIFHNLGIMIEAFGNRREFRRKFLNVKQFGFKQFSVGIKNKEELREIINHYLINNPC